MLFMKIQVKKEFVIFFKQLNHLNIENLNKKFKIIFLYLKHTSTIH